MKKILGILAAVAMVAACNTSCSKSDDNGGGNGGGNTANVRIATWADDWDTYAYTFDAEGKVIKVSRNNGEREWDFTYSGDKIEATGYSAFTITLGANGYASE